MAMDHTGFFMTIIITGTIITIALGGDIIDIELGIIGHITTSLIITDGHTSALIMHLILISIMATTPITNITDRITTPIRNSMLQLADGVELQQGELQT
mgnify:CR=1 FL=1